MPIEKFDIPTDSKILEDLKSSGVEIEFVGPVSVSQNLKETVFTRMIKFNNDKVVKKAIYKKKGINWGFEALEVINL